MPRPPAVPLQAHVDAAALARSGSTIERQYRAADLQRLSEAGVSPDSTLHARFTFAEMDGKPVVEGELSGALTTTCQRCMRPVSIDLAESFKVMIESQEREDEPGGYEPLIAEAARFDLRWLAEEQALLALPLVPMHEDEHCSEVHSVETPTASEEVHQKPFANLRDLLGKS